MQSPQEIQAAFERTISDRLSKRPFPEEKISGGLRERLRVALAFVTLSSLNCDPEHFEAITNFAYGHSNKLSFLEAGFALNAMEQVNSEQLCCSYSVYAETMRHVREAAKYWNEVVQPIKTEVMESFRKKAQLAKPPMGIIKGKA